MLQFWCLSTVRVAYYGSFRENLESAFWGLGLSYHNLIKHMQVFKKEKLKCCSFDASPQSEWLITAHLERIWNQHFGVLECHIAAWLGRCKSSKRAPLKCCSFDASPQSEWLITAHLERIWSQHFGTLECHIAAWLGRCKSSKRAPLKCCNFDASPQSEWLITAHLERIWSQHFGALECHITIWFRGFGVPHHNLIKDMQAFKTEQLKCCSFDAPPQSEWLITAHLERICNQYVGALDCHITTWWNTCMPSDRSSWNVAFLMPLPSQSGLSRLI